MKRALDLTIQELFTYLVPVFFNVNSSTFRKAYAATKPVRDNIKIKLFIVGDEWLDNEGCDGSFASAHLHLLM